MEERRKYPFEATVTPEVLDRGRHWITVQLRNISTERLVDVSATLYTYNSYDLDVLPSGSFHFVKELAPQDTEVLNFQVFANHTGRVYLHVTAYRDGALVSWYSPDQEVRLVEDPAEIQTFFVNRPYWAYEETIETETVVHAHRDMSESTARDRRNSSVESPHAHGRDRYRLHRKRRHEAIRKRALRE